MAKQLEIKIFGQVQGVGFRYSAYEKFVDLGLTGTATNEPDRSIKIQVTGEPAALEQLVEWCRKGPGGARVEKVETHEPQEPFPVLKNS